MLPEATVLGARAYRVWFSPMFTIDKCMCPKLCVDSIWACSSQKRINPNMGWWQDRKTDRLGEDARRLQSHTYHILTYLQA